MTQQWPAGWSCIKRNIICGLNLTKWIEIESPILLLGARGFAYNEDIGDLCSIDVQDIAHPSTVKLFCPTSKAGVFSTGLEIEQPSFYDTTKIGRLNLIPKEESYSDPM